MSDVAVRAAVAGDLNLLVDLYARCFDEPWPRPAVRSILATPGCWALLAALAAPAGIAGFALARTAADEAEILSLGVVPEHRRRGVGGALVGAILQGAAALDVKQVFLEVGEDNPAAIALYRAAGFVEVGRRPGYYRRADRSLKAALIMRCRVAIAK